MYLELLKKIYYEERQKLENMWIYKQETIFKVIGLRHRILEKLESCLNVSEISGRTDIAQEVKDNLLLDNEKSDVLQQRLDLDFEQERKKLEEEEKAAARDANYNPRDYADYLFQAEKMYLLEAELSERGLYPEQVYIEQKELSNCANKPNQAVT